MTSQFTWIPIYQELANELTGWERQQSELIEFLKELDNRGFVVTPLNDKDEDGQRFLVEEMDPFTFMGVFNRQITLENRLRILVEMKSFFNLSEKIPTDFDGIPVLNNQRSWFFAYRPNRETNDIDRLWNVFKIALLDNPLSNPSFLRAFDEALKVWGTNVNLTMGLFWIRPNTFLGLDQNNRSYLDIIIPSRGLSSEFYVDIIEKVTESEKSIPQISYEAWKTKSPIGIRTSKPTSKDIDYWLVSAYWEDNDPPDQTERFLDEGVWINRHDDRYIDVVRSMNVGDKIAIKSNFTQKNGLPFNNRGNTVSGYNIKAIGTIVDNHNDGKTVEVEWEPDFEQKVWYFYTYIHPIWHLRDYERPEWQEAVEQLIGFVWYGQEQDYEFFTNLFWGEEKDEQASDIDEISLNPPYSIEDIIASGVFLIKEELQNYLEKLHEKKAIIIQGPPGVGKTFIARKIAFAHMQEIDTNRLEFIQFHQSYSYDDFIRGYRPAQDNVGSFKIQNGIFFEFCQKAMEDPDRDYVFIIDEINRGNLSQIFGEVLMLIERDKRGKDFSVPLVYRKENEARFYVPQNLYLIGLMNLADRSLAMVDYALRRRFGFIDLTPQFESDLYSNWLSERLMNPNLIQLIVNKLSKLNTVIKEDPVLGENYQIGHSYFCPRGDDFSGLTEDWYKSIILTEIIPLLKEYWFDSPSKVQEAINNLLL